MSSINNVIQNYVTNVKQSIYIAPNIDQIKLSHYLRIIKQELNVNISADSVLVYYDETILGGGDTGVALTSDKLICYIPLRYKGVLKLSDIKSVKASGMLYKISITTKQDQEVAFTLTKSSAGAQKLADIIKNCVSEHNVIPVRAQDNVHAHKQMKPLDTIHEKTTHNVQAGSPLSATTLMQDMITLYTFMASWEARDAETFEKRMDLVVEKLSGWFSGIIQSQAELADLVMKSYNLIADEGEKSEEVALNMNRKCSDRIKSQCTRDQLQRIINEIRVIMVSASEREIEGINAMCDHFGVASKSTPKKTEEESGKRTAHIDSDDRGAQQLQNNYKLIYETNAVTCSGNVLSYLFSRKRLAEMGLIEPDDDYSDDIDQGTEKLNLDIIEVVRRDISTNGRVPLFVFDDEDDDEAWQKQISICGPNRNESTLEEIYRSLNYPSKRGPFFFGHDFFINRTMYTSVILTQDGLIVYDPQEEGQWRLCAWEAWSGTEVATVEGSPEPVLHFIAGDAPDLDISCINKTGKQYKTSHHGSIILVMQAIIEQFWDVVESNRNSKTIEIPSNKFRLVTSSNINDYVSEMLDKVGITDIQTTKQKSKSISAVETDAKDGEGKNALIRAAEEGDTETVELLLDRGADIEAEDEDGWTALHFTASEGHTETVKLLLDRGADIEAKDNEGKTALMRAEEEGEAEVVKLFKKYAAERKKETTQKQGAKEQVDVETTKEAASKTEIQKISDEGANVISQNETLYRRKVMDALADGIVSDLERTGLDFFQRKLKLTDEDALRIFEEVIAEMQGKPEGRAVKTRIDDNKKKAVVEESMPEKAGQEDEGVGKSSKKRITYSTWDEFEKGQGEDPLKKRFMPIAEKIHELVIKALEEQNLPYEVRYGGGTFSFAVPKDLAKSGKRTCARFGLLDLSGKNSYLESLYKKEDDPLPQGAEYWRKNDLTQFQYSFYLDPETPIQDQEKSIRVAILVSYGTLSKGE